MHSQEERYLTPEQIAALLQVNVVTVRRWLKSGKLKGYHFGRKLWRVSSSQLEEFLAFEFDQGTGRTKGDWERR